MKIKCHNQAQCSSYKLPQRSEATPGPFFLFSSSVSLPPLRSVPEGPVPTLDYYLPLTVTLVRHFLLSLFHRSEKNVFMVSSSGMINTWWSYWHCLRKHYWLTALFNKKQDKTFLMFFWVAHQKQFACSIFRWRFPNDTHWHTSQAIQDLSFFLFFNKDVFCVWEEIGWKNYEKKVYKNS